MCVGAPRLRLGIGDLYRVLRALAEASAQETKSRPSGADVAKRIKEGDILEVATAKGLAYVQVTHRHPTMGQLIRVLPGFFSGRPNDFEALAEQEHVFVTFIPASAMVSQGIVERVATVAVPKSAKKFPLFRGVGTPPGFGKQVWWLWDGEQSWKIGNLKSDQVKLPVRGVWTDVTLIQGIEQGYRPENDPQGHGPYIPPEYR